MRRLDKAKHYLRLARARNREGGVSITRQITEMAYLRLFNGVHASEYLAAGLFRRDLSFREKREFIMAKPYFRMLRRANSQDYRFVALHKVVTYGILELFGVPTPRFLGVVSAASGRTHDGKPLREPKQLVALLERVQVERICFKPVGSWGGSGFSMFSVDRRGPDLVFFREPDGTRMMADELWRSLLPGGAGPAHVCQEAVRQHEELAKLHPWSVNTVRIWVYQAERGRWEVFGALLRMGVEKMLVDNTSAGGITARIDLQTGRLAAATDEGPEGIRHAVHPTTGAAIEGVALPMWNDVLELSVRAASAFPYFRLLGLDIAIGADGPLVIEMECGPSPEHQITFGRGARSLLAELARRGPLVWRES